MYFITIKRMLEVCFSAHPNIQYRASFYNSEKRMYEDKRLYYQNSSIDRRARI